MSDPTAVPSQTAPLKSQGIVLKGARKPRKPTSQKKVEANRRNARRSTGPKTERGKRIVSRNAIKHGLLARDLVITRGDGAEDPAEFERLLKGLHDGYKPVGLMEETLVDKIGAELWKIARAQRGEAGQIRKRVDNAAMAHTLAAMEEANLKLWLLTAARGGLTYRGSKEVPAVKAWLPDISRLQSELKTTPEGVKYLITVLTVVKRDIQNEGYLSEYMRKLLMDSIGYCEHSLVGACFSLAPPSKDSAKDGTDDQSTKDDSMEMRKIVISALDQELDVLTTLDYQAQYARELQLDAEVKSRALPDEKTISLFIRYEAHMDRKLYRAMDQLERLQRQRKGENVPPPLNVNLGGRG